MREDRIEQLRDLEHGETVEGFTRVILTVFQRRGIAPSSLRLPAPESLGDPVIARVEQSRWLADCLDCRGAERVNLDDPRFYCLSCFNRANDGNYRPVVFPANLEAIEDILMVRPVAENRNWTADETVADLERENQEHDLELRRPR